MSGKSIVLEDNMIESKLNYTKVKFLDSSEIQLTDNQLSLKLYFNPTEKG